VENLSHHQASEKVRKKANAAGIDLVALKETDPAQYKMLNAERLLEVEDSLLELASGVFFALFPRHDLFSLPGRLARLLAFPPLSASELARFDKGLAQLLEHPSYQARLAYFRMVSDAEGEHRQLALPLSPASWQGESNVLVGPFANQLEAESWAKMQVKPQATDDKNGTTLIYDAVPLASSWVCDIFLL
jgi:hypothetical protein